MTATDGVPPGPARSRVDRFREGLRMDFDRWHDGVGYDLALLDGATPAELDGMESVVLHHLPRDARDVEALAAFAARGSARAAEAVGAAFREGDTRVRAAVLRHAPDLVPDAARWEFLGGALARARMEDGLGPVLDLLEEGVPPAVVPRLWRGVEEREGPVAFHLAALIVAAAGHRDPAFDPEWRPLLLRFNTEDPLERQAALRALRERL